MAYLNPQIIEKDGKKEFVVLPYEEFLKLEEDIACYDDLRLLRDAKEEEQNAPSVSFEKAKSILGVE
jgi:hypothetical protein